MHNFKNKTNETFWLNFPFILSGKSKSILSYVRTCAYQYCHKLYSTWILMEKKIPEFLRILSNQYYRRNNFYCTYDTDVSTYLHSYLTTKICRDFQYHEGCQGKYYNFFTFKKKIYVRHRRTIVPWYVRRWILN